jgi:ParB family chromosome partitioning protein
MRREVAERAVARGWSVRDVERLTKRLTEVRSAKVEEAEEVDPNVKAAITELERRLGTRVRILERAGSRGRIEIEYYSSEDLDRIYSLIVGE